MKIEKDILADGLKRALELVDEDEATAILVIAVHRGGHGVRIWSSGDLDDQDVIKDRLMRAIPLSRKKEEDDVAS